jgi:hypothetical protein
MLAHEGGRSEATRKLVADHHGHRGESPPGARPQMAKDADLTLRYYVLLKIGNQNQEMGRFVPTVLDWAFRCSRPRRRRTRPFSQARSCSICVRKQSGLACRRRSRNQDGHAARQAREGADDAVTGLSANIRRSRNNSAC